MELDHTYLPILQFDELGKYIALVVPKGPNEHNIEYREYKIFDLEAGKFIASIRDSRSSDGLALEVNALRFDRSGAPIVMFTHELGGFFYLWNFAENKVIGKGRFTEEKPYRHTKIIAFDIHENVYLMQFDNPFDRNKSEWLKAISYQNLINENEDHSEFVSGSFVKANYVKIVWSAYSLSPFLHIRGEKNDKIVEWNFETNTALELYSDTNTIEMVEVINDQTMVIAYPYMNDHARQASEERQGRYLFKQQDSAWHIEHNAACGS